MAELKAADEVAPADRLRALRRLHGLTQLDLATRSSVSVSQLAKVEERRKQMSWDLASKIAPVLRVSPGRLLGERWREESARPSKLDDAVPGIRRQIALYNAVPDLERPPASIEHLHTRLEEACRMRLDARYDSLACVITPLLEQLTAVALEAGGRRREQAMWMLAAAYRCADALVYKLGYLDLAAAAADRVAWAAEHSGDELMVATAAYVRAEGFFDADAYVRGKRMLTQAAEKLAVRASGDVRAASVYGAMHSRAAVLAAKAGDAREAASHLRMAASAASLLERDCEYFYTSFGPSNLRIHEVAVHVELGDGAAALAAAGDWAPPRAMPAERASHHYIDLARAQIWEGDLNAAIASLARAAQLAPLHARTHPEARAAAETILLRSRTGSRLTVELAATLGLIA